MYCRNVWSAVVVVVQHSPESNQYINCSGQILTESNQSIVYSACHGVMLDNLHTFLFISRYAYMLARHYPTDQLHANMSSIDLDIYK